MISNGRVRVAISMRSNITSSIHYARQKNYYVYFIKYVNASPHSLFMMASSRGVRANVEKRLKHNKADSELTKISVSQQSAKCLTKTSRRNVGSTEILPSTSG